MKKRLGIPAWATGLHNYTIKVQYMHDETKWKIYQIIPGFVALIIGIFAIYNSRHTTRELFKNYPLLTRDQEISGYVRSVVSTELRGRNGQFIVVGDSLRMYVFVDNKGAINREKYELTDVLRKDCYLSKAVDNDTLLVYDYRDTFYFLIRQMN